MLVHNVHMMIYDVILVPIVHMCIICVPFPVLPKVSQHVTHKLAARWFAASTELPCGDPALRGWNASVSGLGVPRHGWGQQFGPQKCLEFVLVALKGWLVVMDM